MIADPGGGACFGRIAWQLVWAGIFKRGSPWAWVFHLWASDGNMSNLDEYMGTRGPQALTCLAIDADRVAGSIGSAGSPAPEFVAMISTWMLKFGLDLRPV